MSTVKPATPAQQIAVIGLATAKARHALRHRPHLLDTFGEDLREMYFLAVGINESVDADEEAQAAADEDEAYTRNADGAGQPPVHLAHSA